MPWGLKRFQQAESLHFVTFSCYHRYPYLSASEPKSLVEAILEQTRARHDARIYAYVLMPEHVHLLINEPPRILLAQFIKSFKQMTSRRLKGSLDRFWQVRYFDENVRGEKSFSEVVQYIHRNPVKRGLVDRPEQYPWSSYGHYATGNRGTVEIESEWTARHRQPLSVVS
jgi:putative transposase